MKKMMEKLLNIENQIEIIEKPKIRFDNEIILQKLGNINLDKLNEILGEVDGVDNKKVSKMKETTKKPFIKRAGSANKKKRKKAKEEDCEKAVLTGRSFFPGGDRHLEIAKKRSIFAIYRDREINTQTQEEIDRKTHKNSYRWYRTVTAQMNLTVFAAKGSPKEAVEALRKGYYATAEDPEYRKSSKKLTGVKITFTPLATGLQVIKTFKNVSPELKAVFKEMGEKGGATTKKKK